MVVVLPPARFGAGQNCADCAQTVVIWAIRVPFATTRSIQVSEPSRSQVRPLLGGIPIVAFTSASPSTPTARTSQLLRGRETAREPGSRAVVGISVSRNMRRHGVGSGRRSSGATDQGCCPAVYPPAPGQLVSIAWAGAVMPIAPTPRTAAASARAAFRIIFMSCTSSRGRPRGHPVPILGVRLTARHSAGGSNSCNALFCKPGSGEPPRSETPTVRHGPRHPTAVASWAGPVNTGGGGGI